MSLNGLFSSEYSDAVYVDGVCRRDPLIERALHYSCKRYFDEHYSGIFFVSGEHKDEIFQETFIQLWENIMKKKIYVEEGVLKVIGGERLAGKLMTYFMGIAKMKYLEWTRQKVYIDNSHGDAFSQKDFYELYEESDDDVMQEIIFDCMSHMSERCNQILTMFYYERKTLDYILYEIPTFNSKDALKTAKYKCMENLRDSAKSIYHSYFNKQL